MSKQVQIAALAVAALALGGGGFAAGLTVGPALERSGVAETASPSGRPGAAGGANAQIRIGGAGGLGAAAFAGQGQQVSGRVLSVNDGSLTIEIRQPGSDTSRSVIALVGPSARVVRTVESDIKLGDIKAGEGVLVVGQPDAATGTVSASAVVVGVNALQQVFGGGSPRPAGGPRPSPSGSPRP